MKRTAIVFVAVMVLLAGCGGGDGTVTPASSPTTESTSTQEMTSTDGTPVTETSTDGTPTDETPADGTPTDGTPADGTPTDGTPTDGTPTDTPPPDDDPGNDSDTIINESTRATLQSAFNDTGDYEGPSRIDLTLLNGSRETDLTVINDTEEELTIYNQTSFSGPTTYYVTDGPDAVRNLTSGETRYGTGDSTIQQSAGLTQGFTLLAAFVYVGIMDWEPGGETTVDGETALVLEADSINQSALNDSEGFNFDFDPSEVDSAEGEIVVTERGIRSLSVTVETPEGVTSVEMDVELGDDIEVDRPDWVDDSEFDD